MSIRIFLDGVPKNYHDLARDTFSRAWAVMLPDRERPTVFSAPHADNLRAALLWAVENGQRFESVAVATLNA